jgi:hypothetical protein
MTGDEHLSLFSGLWRNTDGTLSRSAWSSTTLASAPLPGLPGDERGQRGRRGGRGCDCMGITRTRMPALCAAMWRDEGLAAAQDEPLTYAMLSAPCRAPPVRHELLSWRGDTGGWWRIKQQARASSLVMTCEPSFPGRGHWFTFRESVSIAGCSGSSWTTKLGPGLSCLPAICPELLARRDAFGEWRQAPKPCPTKRRPRPTTPHDDPGAACWR